MSTERQGDAEPSSLALAIREIDGAEGLVAIGKMAVHRIADADHRAAMYSLLEAMGKRIDTAADMLDRAQTAQENGGGAA